MKYFLAIPILMLVSACGGSNIEPPPTRPVVIQSEPIDIPALQVPAIEQVRARGVEWVIVTPDNVQDVFDDMRSRGEPLALFTLNERGYENLSINTQESLRIILQQQSVINGYNEYYVLSRQRILEHNRNLNRQ